jgi:hypothetical protein
MSESTKHLLAYLIIAVVAVFGVTKIEGAATNTIYQSQLSGCVRGNTLRGQLDHNVVQAAEANSRVLVSFLKAGAAAREADYKANHLQSDANAAFDYLWLAKYDQTHVHLTTFGTVDCAKVYPRP